MERQVRIVIRGVAKREERVGWKKELHKEQILRAIYMSTQGLRNGIYSFKCSTKIAWHAF